MATKITRDRWFIAAVAIAVLTACAPRAAARSADGGDVWIRNVHVIDPATGLEQRDRALRIRDGDIVAVVNDRDAQPERSVRVLDGAGSYAIPGLWDAHVHIMQNDSATTMLYAARLLAFGITHARDMGSVPAVRAATVPQLRDATVSAPSILSAGPAFWAFRLPYGDDRQKMIVEHADSIEHAVDRV